MHNTRAQQNKLFVGEVESLTRIQSLDKIKGNCCEANLISAMGGVNWNERRQFVQLDCCYRKSFDRGGSSFLLVICNEHSGRRSCSLMFVMVLFVLNPLLFSLKGVCVANLPVSLLQKKKVVKKKGIRGGECRLVSVRMARIILLIFIFGWVLGAVC